MSDWKHALLGVISDLETFYDERKFALQKRLGLGELIIQPYLGHGSQERLYLKARVLRDKHITSALDDDTIWTNLLNMYKRYESDEIPGARVRASVGDASAEAVADDEGFVYFELSPTIWPQANEAWYDIELELIDYPGKDQNPAEPQTVKAIGKVIVPPVDAEFGVISDIDDTVLQTNVLDLLAMARNTFLMNSRTRLPFEGVAAFYQALRRGSGNSINPIYYVSSSAWNLFDMLYDFFVVRNIPLGPFFLVDMGIDATKFIMPSHHEHKVTAVQTLLDTHPDLPFILIGDSGQKDPEIYLEIIEQNPGRILAVYIRDVRSGGHDQHIGELGERARALGAELLGVTDTVAAAVHASTHGWISPDALPIISEDTDEDKKAPTPLEEAINPGLQAEARAAEATEPAPAAGDTIEELREKKEEVQQQDPPPAPTASESASADAIEALREQQEEIQQQDPQPRPPAPTSAGPT